MDTFTHILNGFEVAMQPINLWYTFLGVFMGTIIGVLPGIGPSAGIALLIPITYGMDPTSALIMTWLRIERLPLPRQSSSWLRARSAIGAAAARLRAWTACCRPPALRSLAGPRCSA